MSSVGRPSDAIRDAWALRFAIPTKQRDMMRDPLLHQLSHCKSDEARRIILGVKPPAESRLASQEQTLLG
jgi:hypothetical protein